MLLAGEAGFEARPLWVADKRAIVETIVEGADALASGRLALDQKMRRGEWS
jgi:hypothetical protein